MEANEHADLPSHSPRRAGRHRPDEPGRQRRGVPVQPGHAATTLRRRWPAAARATTGPRRCGSRGRPPRRSRSTSRSTPPMPSPGRPDGPDMGIYPQLSALEMLVYPKTSLVIANTVLLALGTIEIIPPSAPLTIFVWGAKRAVPVKVAEFSITEEAYDAALNPIRAKVSLGSVSSVRTYRSPTQATGCSSPIRSPRRRWRYRPASGLGDVIGGDVKLSDVRQDSRYAPSPTRRSAARRPHGRPTSGAASCPRARPSRSARKSPRRATASTWWPPGRWATRSSPGASATPTRPSNPASSENRDAADDLRAEAMSLLGVRLAISSGPTVPVPVPPILSESFAEAKVTHADAAVRLPAHVPRRARRAARPLDYRRSPCRSCGPSTGSSSWPRSACAQGHGRDHHPLRAPARRRPGRQSSSSPARTSR